MFVLRATMEKVKKENEDLNKAIDMQTKDNKRDIERLNESHKAEVEKLKQEMSIKDRECDLRVQEAVQRLREEMTKRLVESDIARESALGKLAIYEKMDTKADANTIKEMVGKLIESIGKNVPQISMVK